MSVKDFEDKFLTLDEAVESSSSLTATAKQKEKTQKKSRPKRTNKRRRLKMISGGLGVLILFGLILVSKAGMLELPLLTPLFYRQPEPARVIAPAVNGKPDTTGVGSNFDQQTNIFSVTLNEEVLTHLLRQWQSNIDNPLLSENPQIVITEGELELFGFLLKPFKTDFVTIRFKPNVNSQNFSFRQALKVTKFRIGNLSLPPFIGNLIFKEYVEGSIRNLLAQFGGIAQGINLSNSTIQVRNIILTERLATIEFAVDLERIKENLKQLPQLLQRINELYSNQLNNQ